MALGTTDITTTLIRNTLAEDNNQVSELCLSTLINKWSRYKPVRGAYPAAGDGRYGLDIVNNWGYLKPRGLANNEPYRMGDFRQYEHNATTAAKCVPPIHVLTSEFENATIYPYGGGNSANISRIRCYRIAGDNEYGILPSLFTPNLDNYYYGLKYTIGGNTWYKTYGLVSSLDSVGIYIAFDATLVESTPGADDWHYNDLPQGVGSATGSFIIASSSCPTWTLTAPTTVYLLPSGTFSGIAYSSGGSFTVNNWIIPSIEVYTWDGFTEETIELTIKTEVGQTWKYNVSTLPAWITIDIGRYAGEPAEWESLLSTPSEWTTGKIVRLTPATPISSERTGVLDLQDSNSITLFSVNLTQDEEHVLPTASITANGFTATSKSATVTRGLTSLPYHFVPNVTGDAQFSIRKDGHVLIDLTFTDTLEDSTQYGGIFTLPSPAAWDEVYEIIVTYPA